MINNMNDNNDLEKMIKLVTTIQKRFDLLNVQYVSIGQQLGKNIYIFAQKEHIDKIKSYMLDEEIALTIFTNSTT
jgi:hypothetical protein